MTELEQGASANTDAAESVTVAFVVPADSVFFQGHFEGDPIFPAVAQLSELIVPAVTRAWPDLAVPSAFRRVKFTRILRPGSECVLTMVRSGTKVEFRVESAGLVCSGVVEFRAGAEARSR